MKFYYDYKKFKENFEKHFEKWQKSYPNGSIKDFKKEYLKMYKPFYTIKEDEVIFEINNESFTYKEPYENTMMTIERFKELVEIIYSREKKYNNLLYSDFIKQFKENQIKKGAEILGIDLNICQIDLNIFNVLIKFIKGLNEEIFIEELDKKEVITTTITIDAKALKNFEFSLRKIVFFLLKESNEIAKSFKTGNITYSQLAELVKALYLQGSITGNNQDYILQDFCDFFGIKKGTRKMSGVITEFHSRKDPRFLEILNEKIEDHLVKQLEKNRLNTSKK